MGNSQSSTTGDEHQSGATDRSLRAEIEKARAGEARAHSLLDAVASLMGVSDPVEVMRGIAENAVRHVGLPEVRVYQVDHDAGALVETARVAADGREGELPLPGMTPVQSLEVDAEPVAMKLGNSLGEFALGNRTEAVREAGAGEDGGELLVQMRTARTSGAGNRGALVGIIAASWTERPTDEDVDLMCALASLGASAAEAARVEEFRSQLVSSVSHELRTPLAAIRAYNELLIDEDAGEINEEQRLFLERIETTCLLLDRMVEDLLDLSRLRAGEMVIRRSPVDVVAVIEHIVDALSPEAARRNVSLTDEIVGDLPLISSNADRLAQVLFNLVGNAVKYVQQGGTVLIRAAVCDPENGEQRQGSDGEQEAAGAPDRGRCLLVEVIDDGPGIARDELDRVFDEFYRGRLTEGSTKGSGLGLAIASRLTRLLGGVLEVDSIPGEGSTFWLMFPIETADWNEKFEEET